VRPVHGFRSREKLAEHFYSHVTLAKEFNCKDEDEYEQRAIRFMTRPLDADTKECIRDRDKAVIRFDKRARVICFLSADGHIGSYFQIRVKDAESFFQRKCRGA
jgi:uncharacterized protein (DUF1697 family)